MGKVDGGFLGRGGSLKMGVDSGGWGWGGWGAGSLLSSFSFFSFFFSGVVWMGGFQSQGCLKHNLFLGRREEWRGEEEGGRGEETCDGSDKFCLVELEFFGGVDAAGVGEGGGEVVGGFGEVGGEREGGDGDDGVFNW